MNDLLTPVADGTPTVYFLLGALVGFGTFGLGLVAMRAFGGRPGTLPPSETADDDLTPDPFTFGSKADRRAAHRRQGNHISVVIAHNNEPHLEGRVHDRSMGGIGLTAARDFQPGTVIRVKPNNGSPTAPWVDLVVKSCVPQGGDWQIGCSFVKTPPYSVILMFG